MTSVPVSAPSPSLGAQQACPVVLIVEDDPAARDMLQVVLEVKGYAVEVVIDGATALARIEAGGLDLVLLDWMLPGIEGLEVCRWVRAQAAEPYLPIIMLTPRLDEEARHAGFAAGVDDYLTKPFGIDDLLDRVQVWIRTRQRLVAAHEQQRRLEAEQAAKARLEGVLLGAQTLEHELNNRLTLTVGWMEWLSQNPSLPPTLHRATMEALRGAQEAASIVSRFRRLTRIEEKSWGPNIGSTIDLTGSPD